MFILSYQILTIFDIQHGCQTHFSSGATWRQIFLKRVGSVKKVSFLKKNVVQKKVSFIYIKKHNIKKNFLAGRTFNIPDIQEIVLIAYYQFLNIYIYIYIYI